MEDVIVNLKKKYEEQWIPEEYVKQYIITPNPWESQLISSLHETMSSGNVKGPRGIDIGCGPTVHRMSILGNVCDEIVACDFTTNNIIFVKRYLEGQETDVLAKSLQIVARLQGYKNIEEGEQELRDSLRSKVKHVVQFDLTNDESVNSLAQYGGEFDCAISHGCLESACLTYDSYVAALKRIHRILKPGAAFVLSGYLSGDHYFVGDIKFECFNWDDKVVRNGLTEAGFRVDSLKTFEENSTVSDICNCSSSFFSVSYKP